MGNNTIAPFLPYIAEKQVLDGNFFVRALYKVLDPYPFCRIKAQVTAVGINHNTGRVYGIARNGVVYQLLPEETEIGRLGKVFRKCVILATDPPVLWFSPPPDECSVCRAEYPYKEWDVVSTRFALFAPPCSITHGKLAQTTLVRGTNFLTAVISPNEIALIGDAQGGWWGYASTPQIAYVDRVENGVVVSVAGCKGTLGECTITGNIEWAGALVEEDIAVVNIFPRDVPYSLVCVFERNRNGRKGKIVWAGAVSEKIIQTCISAPFVHFCGRSEEGLLVHTIKRESAGPLGVAYMQSTLFSCTPSDEMLVSSKSDTWLEITEQFYESIRKQAITIPLPVQREAKSWIAYLLFPSNTWLREIPLAAGVTWLPDISFTWGESVRW